MAKKRLRKFPSPERWVGLRHFLLNSQAWITMSPNAKAILIHVWQRHNGVNNGEITYAVREAEEIGIKRSMAAVALRELVERGFLRINRDSRFNMKARLARTWTITDEKVGGERATRDYMRWPENPEHSPSNRTASPSYRTYEQDLKENYLSQSDPPDLKRQNRSP